jgi:hypothetical protein
MANESHGNENEQMQRIDRELFATRLISFARKQREMQAVFFLLPVV